MGDFALWEADQLKVNKVISAPDHRIYTGRKVIDQNGKEQDEVESSVPITAMARHNYLPNIVSVTDSYFHNTHIHACKHLYQS